MKSRAYAAGAAVIGSAAAAYILVGRPRQLGWGAADEEAGAPPAGDDLIPAPDLVATRAITVHAPADQIWPWIAQLGQGRGGFYSYDALGAVPLAARSGHQERPDRAEGKLRAKRLDPAASDRRICRLSYMTGIPETCRPGRSQGNQIARTPIATSTIPAAWPSGLP